jgi:hypothetical protein
MMPVGDRQCDHPWRLSTGLDRVLAAVDGPPAGRNVHPLAKHSSARSDARRVTIGGLRRGFRLLIKLYFSYRYTLSAGSRKGCAPPRHSVTDVWGRA